MNDGLNMYVDETSHHVNALRAIGEDLEDAARSALGAVGWLSGTLGQGPMGTRFKGRYEPDRATLFARIEAGQRRTDDLAVAGQQAVDHYDTASAHAVAELLRVRYR